MKINHVTVVDTFDRKRPHRLLTTEAKSEAELKDILARVNEHFGLRISRTDALVLITKQDAK